MFNLFCMLRTASYILSFVKKILANINSETNKKKTLGPCTKLNHCVLLFPPCYDLEKY